MATTKVTPELGKIVRDLRKQAGITAADLAKAIRKSSGYISNIENSKAKIINCKDMFDIFEVLVSDAVDKSRVNDFLNSIKIDFDPSDITSEIKREFFILFDKQFRAINIEESLVEYIKTEMDREGFTVDDVIAELNSNRAVENPEKYQKNKLIVGFLDDNFSVETIVFDLPTEFLSDILSRNTRSTNYIRLLGIVYALRMLIESNASVALSQAKAILYENRIYTLDERNKIMHDEEQLGVLQEIKRTHIDKSKSKLSEELIQYYEALNGLVDVLDVIKDEDAAYTAQSLENLAKSLNTYRVTSMALALLAMPLTGVETLTVDEQKLLFSKIRRLVEDTIGDKERNRGLEIEPF